MRKNVDIWREGIELRPVNVRYFDSDNAHFHELLDDSSRFFGYMGYTADYTKKVLENIRLNGVLGLNIDGVEGKKWENRLNSEEEDFCLYLNLLGKESNAEIINITDYLISHLIEDKREVKKQLGHYEGQKDGDIGDYLRRFNPATGPATFKGFEPFNQLYDMGAIDDGLSQIRTKAHPVDEHYLVLDREKMEGIELEKHAGKPGVHSIEDFLSNPEIDNWEVTMHPKWYR